ncbi:MAG: MBL fold metallo-hydrolase [Prevotellaceae bacterium]|jgi:glyoxylase-like metal-dependent hydrolase (beta-lactamase superfamily II)|nr:MBL fold metallo-hydrolase [Prevotellaceae bacterium]
MMKKICGLGTASMILLACTSPEKQLNMNIFTQTVGTAKVSLLSEGQNTGNSATLIGATPEMFRECAPDSTYPSAVNAFLVQLSGHTILIDAGFGNQLLQNLKSLGVTARQIDIVALTHLHGDHTGGMLRDGKPVFPNATVYVSQPEYDYWMSDEAMNSLPENRRGGFAGARKVLEAYKNRLQLINVREIGETPEPLVPGFYGIAAYGHTPGHVMFMVESGAGKFLIWGDITHATAIQTPYPAVAVTYDVNPGQAVATRHKVMDYVARHHIPVAGAHIACPGMGELLDNRRQGYLFQPADLKEKVQQAVREQLKKYPELRLQDLYKNFFQDYFGPEHLISDTAMAAKYLRQELDSEINPAGAFFEPAGWEGRFYRVDLSAVKEGKIPCPVLLDAFLRSAGHAAKPPLPIWHAQWDAILSHIDALQLSLPDYETDKAALQEILQSGRYAVHHSDAFSDAYHPHYRIVSKKIVEEELTLYLK